MSDIRAAKQDARAEARARVAELSRERRVAASASLCRRLLEWDRLARAGSVMVFDGDDSEPDLSAVVFALAARGVRVAAPRVNWETRTMDAALIRGEADLVPTRHGLRQPGPDASALDRTELDLVLVPGVAFDASGGRLGRGAGYYDRFLRDDSAPEGVTVGPIRTCGVAFEAQIADTVPTEDHDLPVDWIVTEDRLIDCRG